MREGGRDRMNERINESVGGIFTKEMPMHFSNLQLIDPVQDKPTRIKKGYVGDSTIKSRISKLSGDILVSLIPFFFSFFYLYLLFLSSFLFSFLCSLFCL